jgi:hypothetical protein
METYYLHQCDVVSIFVCGPQSWVDLNILPVLQYATNNVNKKTQRVTNTKISWLMLFREMASFYSKNHMKSTKTLSKNAEL